MVGIRVPQDVPLPGINQPMVDKVTGLASKAWYMFFETMRTRSGGDLDKVNDAFTGLDAKVNATTQVIAGNGLSGGGNLSANVTIAALEDVGWTASTGTPAKGAYAAYAGQTVSVGYVQAEAQTTDNAVKALAARVIALEAALRANGGIN